MPKIIKLNFKQQIKRTELIKSFRFYPKKILDFKPGQFAKILFDEDDISNKELNKYLSFSCSPGRDYFEFTKKLSKSQFSEKLNNLKKGDEISIQAPLGNCTFEDNYKRIAFLIGGIGITPVISIIEHIIDKKLNTDVALFYSNRRKEDIAFRGQLDEWQEKYSNIKIIYTITDSFPKEPKYKKGYINEGLVTNQLKDYKRRMFFIFGPPGMIPVMAKLCDNIGCSPDKVKKEGFIGY